MGVYKEIFKTGHKKKLLTLLLIGAMLLTVLTYGYSNAKAAPVNLIVNPSFEDGTKFTGMLDGVSWEQKTLAGWELTSPSNGAGIVKRNAGFTTADPDATGDSYAGFIHGGDRWGLKQTISSGVSINRTYTLTFTVFQISTNPAHVGRYATARITDQSGALLHSYECTMTGGAAVDASTQFTTGAMTTALTISLYCNVDNVQVDLVNLFDPSGLPVVTPDDDDDPDDPPVTSDNLITNPSFEETTLSGASKLPVGWDLVGSNNEFTVVPAPASVTYEDSYATGQPNAMQLLTPWLPGQVFSVSQTVTTGVVPNGTYSLSFILFHTVSSDNGVSVRIYDQNDTIIHTYAKGLLTADTPISAETEFTLNADTTSIKICFEATRDYAKIDLVDLKITGAVTPTDPDPDDLDPDNLVKNPSFEDGDLTGGKKQPLNWDMEGADSAFGIVKRYEDVAYADPYASGDVYAMQLLAPWLSDIYTIKQTITDGILPNKTYSLEYLMFHSTGHEELGVDAEITDQNGQVLKTYSRPVSPANVAIECQTTFTTGADTTSITLKFEATRDNTQIDLVKVKAVVVPDEEPPAGTNLLKNPSFEDGSIFEGGAFTQKNIVGWDFIGNPSDTRVVYDIHNQSHPDEYAAGGEKFAARLSGPWLGAIYGLSQTIMPVSANQTYYLSFYTMRVVSEKGVNVIVTDQSGRELLNFSANQNTNESFRLIENHFNTRADTTSFTISFIGEADSVEMDVIKLYKGAFLPPEPDEWENLIANPSFESGSDGWSLSGAGAAVVTEADAYDDEYLVSGSKHSGKMDTGNTFSQPISTGIIAGLTYHLEFTLIGGTASNGVRAVVTNQNNQTLVDYTASGAEALIHARSFTVPAGTTSLTVRLTGQKSDVRIDVVKLYKSKYKAPDVPVSNNILANPSFEAGLLVANGTDKILTEWNRTGLGVRVKHEPAVYNDSYSPQNKFAAILGSTGSIEQTVVTGVLKSQEYDFSLMLLHADSSAGVRLVVKDNGENILLDSAVKADSDVVRIEKQFTTLASTTAITVRITGQKSGVGVDMLQIYKHIYVAPEPTEDPYVNLCGNASFESGFDGWSTTGTVSITPENGDVFYVDKYAQGIPNAVRMDNGATLSRTITPVKANQIYTLECFLLGVTPTDGILLNVRITDNNSAVLFDSDIRTEEDRIYYTHIVEEFKTAANSSSITVTFTSRKNDLRIDLIKIYEGNTNRNVALGKSMIMRPGFRIDQPSNVTPEKALLGTMNKRAYSDGAFIDRNPNVMPSVTIDLFKSLELNEFVIRMAGSAKLDYRFTVEISNDLLDWTLVWDKTNDDTKNTVFARRIVPARARYVRITKSPLCDMEFLFGEIEVYGKKEDAVRKTPAKIPTEPNIAINKKATASSNNTSTYTPYINDRSITSFWRAESKTFPQWLKYDLGEPTKITGTRLYINAAGTLYRYNIYTSNDDVNYALAVDNSRNTNVIDATSNLIDKMNATARYIKVEFLSSDNDFTADFRVYEFSVYGEDKGISTLDPDEEDPPYIPDGEDDQESPVQSQPSSENSSSGGTDSAPQTSSKSQSSNSSQKALLTLAGVLLGENGKPMGGVEMSLGENQTATTDSSGFFRFDNVKAGTYSLSGYFGEQRMSTVVKMTEKSMLFEGQESLAISSSTSAVTFTLIYDGNTISAANVKKGLQYPSGSILNMNRPVHVTEEPDTRIVNKTVTTEEGLIPLWLIMVIVLGTLCIGAGVLLLLRKRQR